MVPSLARMSVIIKSQHETSVMTGNYEMAYICGLLCRLTGTVPPSQETPQGEEAEETAAPEEMPTSIPSSLARARPVAKASSFSTVMISS